MILYEKELIRNTFLESFADDVESKIKLLHQNCEIKTD